MRHLITPWFIGWVTDVVFGGKKTNFKCDRFSIIGWAGQLSMINATFLHSAWNVLFTSLTHSSSKTLSIQLSLWLISTGKFLNVFKIPWIFYFTNNKHRQFIVNGTGSCQTSNPGIAVFTTWTFLCFQLIGFVWSTFIKQPEFVGVVNVLKIVIRWQSWKCCFISSSYHFRRNGFAFPRYLFERDVVHKKN